SMRASVGPASATGKSAGMTAGAAVASSSRAAPRWWRPRARNSANAAGNCGVAEGALASCRSAPCRARNSSGVYSWPRAALDRKRREQPGKRMGKAGVTAQRADIRLATGSEDLRRERDEARGGAVRVDFEIGKRRHRLVVEIEPARIDERLERRRRQPVARDGGE